MIIRKASPEEAEALTELAMRSKAHWGYDGAFMAACRPVLTITAAYIKENPVFAAEEQAVLAGFCSLVVHGTNAELDNLFIEPAFIGKGCGRLLWDRSVLYCKENGLSEMTIDADPFAEGFYLKMGAARVGESTSTVQPGRLLPRLKMAISCS
jgi:GNAT superfamily N-acetyltransferase